MRQDNHILIVGDWYLGTDGFGFLLLKRHVQQDGRSPKSRNTGKERFDVVGDYSTLDALVDGLHRYLSIDELRQSDVDLLEKVVAKMNECFSEFKILDEMGWLPAGNQKCSKTRSSVIS